MSEPTLPPEKPADDSEPATGPVQTPPAAPGPTVMPMAPPPVYVQESSRLNKAAAWVGIVAGSLFIVVVIFGTGFVIGKQAGDGPRGHHRGGHEMMLRPGPGTPPMGPHGGFERGPGFPGPFGPGGPVIDTPRPPGGSGGSDNAPPPPRPPRP